MYFRRMVKFMQMNATESEALRMCSPKIKTNLIIVIAVIIVAIICVWTHFSNNSTTNEFYSLLFVASMTRVCV